MNQQDRNVLQMLMVVVGALVAFMVVIIIAAKFISGTDMSDKSQDPMVKAATEERIKPIASVTVGAAPAAPAAGGAVDGGALYTANCAGCHDTGAAGAPKVGDKAAWKSRIGQGMDVLVDHAINGFNAMPPRGGSGLDDDAIKAVVKHMADSSK